jgi:hypothetical protein
MKFKRPCWPSLVITGIRFKIFAYGEFCSIFCRIHFKMCIKICSSNAFFCHNSKCYFNHVILNVFIAILSVFLCKIRLVSAPFLYSVFHPNWKELEQVYIMYSEGTVVVDRVRVKPVIWFVWFWPDSLRGLLFTHHWKWSSPDDHCGTYLWCWTYTLSVNTDL